MLPADTAMHALYTPMGKAVEPCEAMGSAHIFAKGRGPFTIDAETECGQVRECAMRYESNQKSKRSFLSITLPTKPQTPYGDG